MIVLLPLMMVLAGCRHLPPPKPLEQLTAEEKDGYAVAQAHCSKCHNDRVDRPKHGPSLVGVFKQPYLPSGAPANDERVTNVIEHGHNLMPALGNDIPPGDLPVLLKYLHTL